MSFAQKLKIIRMENGLTQQEMGERLAMEQSTYSKYEKNKILPNLDLIQRVRDEFKVDAGWLISSDGDQITIGKVYGNGVVKAENYYSVPKDLIEELVGFLKNLKNENK